MLEELVEPIKGSAPGKSIENHAHDDGASIEVHVIGDGSIGDLIDAEFPTESSNGREVVSLADDEFLGEIRE